MKSTKDWTNQWAVGNIGFHLKMPNPMLEKHADKIIDGRSNCKVFIPLCGKSIDIKWFADLGHNVVGVEVAKLAITSFYEEHGIEYVEEPVSQIPGATVYKSKDNKIALYEADLFSLTKDIVGQFDCVWDRASLVAINRTDRQKYVSLLTSLMASNCRYLLSSLDYDATKVTGSPFNIPNSEVEELYGTSCTVEKIETRPYQVSKFPIGFETAETIFLMKPK